LKKASRAKEFGMDSKKCGCVIRRTYELPWTYEIACVIRRNCLVYIPFLLAKKLKNAKDIRLDEVISH